jgi:hypothetical protein
MRQLKSPAEAVIQLAAVSYSVAFSSSEDNLFIDRSRSVALAELQIQKQLLTSVLECLILFFTKLEVSISLVYMPGYVQRTVLKHKSECDLVRASERFRVSTHLKLLLALWSIHLGYITWTECSRRLLVI